MNTLIAASDVTGNVGSCQVNVSHMQETWIKVANYAVDSCTGEVIGNSTTINWAGVTGGSLLAVLFIGMSLLLLSLAIGLVKDTWQGR